MGQVCLPRRDAALGEAPVIAKRLFSLEILRFVAAAFVFLGHYLHFAEFYGLPRDHGLFAVLEASGTPGALAVPIFFLMSGAIFVHTYYDLLVCQQISGADFFRRRLARLYPLHLVTLGVVAAAQAAVMAATGRFFIYPWNDGLHFALQLGFASHWGFERGHSFNGPIWSVSHEIVLYAMFFAVCWGIGRRSWGRSGRSLLWAALVLWAAYRGSHLLLLRSAFAFFAGGSLYVGLRWLRARPVTAARARGELAAFAIGLAAAWGLFAKGGLPLGAAGPLIITACLSLDLRGAIAEKTTLARFAVKMGTLSYSTYLWHFPVQLGFVLLQAAGVVVFDFAAVGVFALYAAVVLAVASASYPLLERPAGQWILQRTAAWATNKAP